MRMCSQAFGSGAGLFVLKASGRGTLAVNALGGILRCYLRTISLLPLAHHLSHMV